MMLIENRVKRTIAKHKMLSPGDTVIVGVSGGPDSMALLYLLLDIKDEYDITLKVAHLNHGFRKEADREAEFVSKIAKNLGLQAVIRLIDVPSVKERDNLSAQEAAREVRYVFFKEAAIETGSNKVALAHTADDQAETVLMRLLRGSGPLGLSGIPPVRDLFIRPLIDSSKREIEEFLSKRGIPFVTDSSNLKMDYLRNRVRIELIPLLEGYNPNIRETLIRNADLAYKDNQFLSMEADRVFNAISSQQSEVGGRQDSYTITMDFKGLKGLHPAIASRVIRKAIASTKGDIKRISFRHISDILNLLEAGEGRWSVHLPEVTVLREHDRLIFKRDKGRR